MAIYCRDHQKETSNIICIDLDCKNQRLMCKICSQDYHSSHNSIDVKKFLNHCQQYFQQQIDQYQKLNGQIAELLLTYQQQNQSNIFKTQLDIFMSQKNFKLDELLKERNINKSLISNQNSQLDNSQKGASLSQNQSSSQSTNIRELNAQQSQIIISNIIRKLDLQTGHLIEISQAKLQFKSQLFIQSQIGQGQNVSILNQQDKLQEYYENGMKEFLAKNYNKSIEQFEKAIKIKGDYEQAWIYKILSHGELKQNKMAIQECEKALNYFQYSKNLVYLYGILLQEDNRYQEALKQFQNIINDNNNDIESLFQAGVSLFELQQYDRAGEYFTNILQIQENHENAYLMQGRIALQKQQFENAIYCFEQCSQNTNATFYLAQIYMSLFEFQKAKEMNNKFCRVFNNDIKGKFQKGQILLLNNEYSEAIKIFKNIILQYPEHSNLVQQIINLQQ